MTISKSDNPKRKIPKKPNKRNKIKTRHSMTPEELKRHAEILGLKRVEQANSIRSKIIENVGDILDEIPTFLSQLGAWVKYGKLTHGKTHIPSMNRDIEWCFHDKVSIFPEVWIRAPKNDSDSLTDLSHEDCSLSPAHGPALSD